MKTSLGFALLFLTVSSPAQVSVEALPEPGMQPQLEVTGAGVVHLVYLKGDPKGCDIRHATRRVEGGAWTEPATVNSEPRSAIAIGTIRGAQLALGKDGSVQVVWNGRAEPKAGTAREEPLLYGRLASGAKAFSPQQNLMGKTTGLDGGASVTANGKGQVSIAWHAAPAEAKGEGNRLVWVRTSTDDGLTFSEPEPLNSGQPGVCACCSLRAQASADGTLTVLYRAATSSQTRGMTLLTRKAGNISMQPLDDWRISQCPMSSASLTPVGPALRAAWENEGRIVTGLLNDPAAAQKIGPKNAKHPAMARNAKGEVLIASVVGSGWEKPGRLHWDVLDGQGKVTDSGDGGALPLWSFVAAYARPDGSFVILR